MKTKIIEIGDWDMDLSFRLNVLHGISDYKKIRTASAIIRDDGDNLNTFLSRTTDFSGVGIPESWGSVTQVDATYIELTRSTGSQLTSVTGFDNTGYDSTSFNRGWVYITYEA